VSCSRCTLRLHVHNDIGAHLYLYKGLLRCHFPYLVWDRCGRSDIITDINTVSGSTHARVNSKCSSRPFSVNVFNIPLTGHSNETRLDRVMFRGNTNIASAVPVRRGVSDALFGELQQSCVLSRTSEVQRMHLHSSASPPIFAPPLSKFLTSTV